MAGHARYTALLDACVLFPVAVCDSLMSVAATGLYAPKSTQRVEDEWTRSLEQRSGRPPGTYNVRRDAVRDAAPGRYPRKPATASHHVFGFLIQTTCMFLQQLSRATLIASSRPT